MVKNKIMKAQDIKKIRNNLGITQQQLADGLGVSINTIQNWEAGGIIPKTKENLILEFANKPQTKEYDIGAAIRKIEAISEVTLSAVSELLAKANGGSSTSILKQLQSLVNSQLNSQE